MSEELNDVIVKEEVEVKEKSSNSWVTGVILVLIGSIMLLSRFFDLPDFGDLVLPGLGGIFLLWGIFTRNSGLLVPGGILSGIGIGNLLQDTLRLEGAAEGGVFLLAFGGGFALITLLSVVFTKDKHFWALIPGAILATIGGALVVGGVALDALEIAGKFWPVILIVLGVYVIFKRRE